MSRTPRRGGWLRRFRCRAAQTGVAFAALAVELGGEALAPSADAAGFAVAAIRAAFENAAAAALIAAVAVGKDLVDDACAKKAVAELTRD